MPDRVVDVSKCCLDQCHHAQEFPDKALGWLTRDRLLKILKGARQIVLA
jgi:hypothetical protein